MDVAGSEVVGREYALAAIAAFVESVAVGPGALMLEGEPGIGRTTVWRAALAAAPASCRVLAARPAEPESAP